MENAVAVRKRLKARSNPKRAQRGFCFGVSMSDAPPPAKEKRRKKRRHERTDSHVADHAPSAVEMTSSSAPPAPALSIVTSSKPSPAETIIPVQDEEAQKGKDSMHKEPPPPPSMSFIRIYLLFMSFGIKAWGGPAVQIQALKHEFVEVRKWISMGKFNRVLAVYQVCFIASLLDLRIRNACDRRSQVLRLQRYAATLATSCAADWAPSWPALASSLRASSSSSSLPSYTTTLASIASVRYSLPLP